jgi:hypothetical protein
MGHCSNRKAGSGAHNDNICGECPGAARQSALFEIAQAGQIACLKLDQELTKNL